MKSRERAQPGEGPEGRTCQGEPLKGCMQSSHFHFKRITVTPEWFMGWRGKERIKETNQEATAASRGEVTAKWLVVPAEVERSGWTGGCLEVEGVSLLIDWK